MPCIFLGATLGALQVTTDTCAASVQRGKPQNQMDGLVTSILTSVVRTGVVQGLGFQWLCAALGFHVQAARIHPGLYALVGGTAMLAGVFRSAISLVVIMLEGTGEKPSCWGPGSAARDSPCCAARVSAAWRLVERGVGAHRLTHVMEPSDSRSVRCWKVGSRARATSPFSAHSLELGATGRSLTNRQRAVPSPAAGGGGIG
jgi:hypothetical protein